MEKPDPGLRISVHLVPTLIPCLLNPGTKNGLDGPPSLLGWEGGDTLIVPLGVPLEYPAPTEPPDLSKEPGPKPAQTFLGL